MSKVQIKIIEKIDEQVAEQIVNYALQIPEFNNSYVKEEYIKRMNGRKCFIEFAYIENDFAGFKLGYEKSKQLFYSWMGGVVPRYRKLGVAKQLAEIQEKWARAKKYQRIGRKTRNYLKNMLHFALSNDFYITGVEEHQDPMENRILLEKSLII